MSRLNTSSRSSGVMIAGTGDACGLGEKNKCNLLRDRASADILCMPGRCLAMMRRSMIAAKKGQYPQQVA